MRRLFRRTAFSLDAEAKIAPEQTPQSGGKDPADGRGGANRGFLTAEASADSAETINIGRDARRFPETTSGAAVRNAEQGRRSREVRRNLDGRETNRCGNMRKSPGINRKP